jgi:uncharacterized protein YlxW (UPF0749 family)
MSGRWRRAPAPAEQAGAPGDDVARRPERCERQAEAGSRSVLAGLLRPRGRPVDLLVAALLGVLGFAAVVQVRSTQEEGALARARQEDLVQILDELSNRDERLRTEIEGLTATRERLTTGSDSTAAALEEARHRAEVLGVLAGTVPADGPGITLVLRDPQHVLSADVLLDALEELRDAGAEAVQIDGPVDVTGAPTPATTSVRVVASTALVDGDGGVLVGGTLVRPPYRFVVLGDAGTLSAALGIPGGVVATVQQRGATAEVAQRMSLRVDALRPLPTPQYARPADGG